MRTLISQAEYARLRGVSRAAVTQAVKGGRITLVDGRIDPEVADIQWKRNTDPLQQRGAAAQASMGSVAVATVAPIAPRGGREQDSAFEAEPSLLDVRTRREQAMAELAELELAEKRGELVAVADIRKALAPKLLSVREGLDTLADRLAPILAAEADPAKVYALLKSEHRQILAQLTAESRGPAELQ